MAGGSLRPVRFASAVAVIEHPTAGVVLFDTGYSARFVEETRRFPERLYALAMPMHLPPGATAVEQLAERGVAPSEVRTVILSHFHVDHVGGTRDFPRARFVYQRSAWEAVRRLRGFSGVRVGFIPAFLPGDFEARSLPVTREAFASFAAPSAFGGGHDLLGDGSVVLVDLPGHARGHTGALVRAEDGVEYFLVGDACWLSKGLREARLPNRVTSLFLDSRTRYAETQARLRDFAATHPATRLVPCHCSEAYAGLPKWSSREQVA